ncbi:hypothetical protein PC128_g16454 [Phytophthora cactorum]|nr:hypothetical protein PC128_g16454 [Phytophthora cactorum]
MYDCNITVEIFATNKAVKSIYKYVYKGSDVTTITDGEGFKRTRFVNTYWGATFVLLRLTVDCSSIQPKVAPTLPSVYPFTWRK